MNIVAQYGIRGDGARGIVTSVEAAIRQGRLAAGAPLPTVRDLARALRVSPTTVAAAYRTLRVRGLVHAQGRRGTRVSARPPLPIRPVAPAPSHLRDLSLGNPDPALLPSLARPLARVRRRPGLYGEPANRPELLEVARRQLDADGARELRAVLRRHPATLVVEDDHAGPVAGVPALSVCHGRERWALVRSVSKSLGPDLRLAILTGDPTTVARVEGRQSVGTGWVSHLLQDLVTALWSDPATDRLLARAAETYAARRDAMVRALAAHGIEAHGRSGLNVWVPVVEEAAIVAALAQAGWAVRAGERYRLKSGPAVRVTVAGLAPRDADRLAAALARSLRPERRL